MEREWEGSDRRMRLATLRNGLLSISAAEAAPVRMLTLDVGGVEMRRPNIPGSSQSGCHPRRVW